MRSGFLVASILIGVLAIGAFPRSALAIPPTEPGYVSRLDDATPPAAPPKKSSARQAVSDAEKIRLKVQERGVGHRVTIVLRNGNEYYGAISKIEDQSFELSEIDLSRQIEIPYSDVKQVRSGFGGQNKFTGKRWHPRWHIVAILAAVGATIALVAAASSGRDF